LQINRVEAFYALLGHLLEILCHRTVLG
ncbi:MAG: hypothetical protein RIQ67_1775, partial [Pseudomonadota bacterium]